MGGAYRATTGPTISGIVSASLVFASYFAGITWVAGVCLWLVMSGIAEALTLLAGWRVPPNHRSLASIPAKAEAA